MEEKLTMRMETLLDNAKALCFEETDLICCLANLSALIMQSVPNINWAGFYLMKQGELSWVRFRENRRVRISP